MRQEFEAYKESIIQDEVDKVREEIAALVQPKRNNTTKLPPKNPPVLLNTQARSPLRFQSSPNLRRKINLKPEAESVLDGIVLADYQIEIVSSETEETQHVYQDTQIEVISEADEQFQVFEEVKDDSSKSKKPKRSLTKDSPKKSTSPTKSSTNLTPTDVDEENYFKIVEDCDEFDENGEKKIFQCAFSKCEDKFARRQLCKTHFYNHLKAKTVSNGYTCSYCQKVFKVASACERHERVHTGVKPFKCNFDECGKAFAQNEMLKRHKLIHLSMTEAPFACNICDKRFRQKEPLRHHINKIHSEDADSKSHTFACTVCDKRFAHSSGLSRHLLIHSGRKFTCEICDKVFNDQSALKRHGSVHRK